MKQCKSYTGVACIDGTCPIAKREEERCYPVVHNCNECHFYRGCEDCCFEGTELYEEELALMDMDNCSSGTYNCTECAIKDGCVRKVPSDLDCAPHSQSIWGRFGLSLELTSEEFSTLMESGLTAHALSGKIERGKFILDGETYFPPTETSQPDVWPVNDDIQFEF